MSVNNMELMQAATLINAINAQATGAQPIAITNSGEFVSVAQTTLKAGYDPVINAISQVISGNIFSNRPYNRKFKGLEMDRERWGAITRKFAPIDVEAEDAVRYTAEDGTHPDMFKLNKPEILATNFYGQNAFDIQLRSIFRDQLDSAFSSVESFNSFYAMITQNFNDVREQTIENMSRTTINNMIAGKIAADANGVGEGSVIYLIDEYNRDTGSDVTASTVFSDENFNSFARWLAGYVNWLAGMMSERSGMFQTQVTGKTINRHTPLQDLRVYLNSRLFEMVKTRVMTDAFNQDNLKIADTEMVNYWQSINAPTDINITPVYMDANGALVNGNNQNVSNVVGVLFDRDAMGINIKSEWQAMAPFEARGGYWNPWYHLNIQYLNDFTEKCVVLLLESKSV